jgi:hypothetical protein
MAQNAAQMLDPQHPHRRFVEDSIAAMDDDARFSAERKAHDAAARINGVARDQEVSFSGSPRVADQAHDHAGCRSTHTSGLSRHSMLDKSGYVNH